MKHIGADSAPVRIAKSIDIILANLFMLFRDYCALYLSAFILILNN